MCGIIGIINKKDSIVSDLISGIQGLEYRGYDSYGVALVVDGALTCIKSINGTADLCLALQSYTHKHINIGVGHTRWATHGEVNKQNAHPHSTDKVAVVHNGVIENAHEIRELLATNGIKCITSTDTEVIPKLLTLYLQQGCSVKDAIEKILISLEGSFAIVAIFAQTPENLVAIKKNSTLLIGISNDKSIITSDVHTASSFVDKVIFLEENDYAFVNSNGVSIYNNGNIVQRTVVNTTLHPKNNSEVSNVEPSPWMLQEIYEQPLAIQNTLLQFESKKFSLFLQNFSKITGVVLVACGSSYFAAHIAREWLEELGIRTYVEIASEFRYRKINISKNEIIIFISQSGETADTLAAVVACKNSVKNKLIAITNVRYSSIARYVDTVFYTAAENEFGVAATKTFTTQIALLRCIALETAAFNNKSLILFTREQYKLINLSARYIHIIIDKFMHNLQKTVRLLCGVKSVLYIGRGVCYSLAQEGALKLKELTYIHAEAFAAGELKHGPIALIDKETIVIAIAPSNLLFNKMHTSIEEVCARGGKIIAITDDKGNMQLHKTCTDIIELPCVDRAIIPFIYTIPLQIIAYQVAIAKGCNVDRPRNLAKSVTVE